MIKREIWDWRKNEKDLWMRPATHMAYLGQRWISHGLSTVLDLGAGLGRNSVYLAKQYRLRVTAIDISEYAVNFVKQSAIEENVMVDAVKGDMFNTPFNSSCFDCVFSYNVTSNLTTKEFEKLLTEINRIVKPGGEIYITLLSKSSAGYKNATKENMLDNNTIIVRDENGVEKHEFYVDIDDIVKYFSKFEILDEVVEYNVYNLQKSDIYSKYFGILVRKR
jgi:ubiquinone/menaquinone biosynthesis C-methylase UbiE